jgi:hypothetical protein
MSESEVLKLRQQLQEQAQAAQMGLYGFAQVGRHQAITSRMERMGETLQALIEKVGKQEAARILIEIEEHLYEGHPPHLINTDAQQQAPQSY